MWLPHIGQCLSAEREHGNTEDHFVIVVREHSDTGADEDVDDRPVVGTPTTRGRPNLSAVSST